MTSIRLRLLALLLAMLAAAAALMAAVTYRNVLAQTEALFDYQLRQMALSLREQGEVTRGDAPALADRDLDFVVQIWSADGRTIYATRRHDALPARALLGLADVTVGDQTWRTYSVATPTRVIQVAQPRQIRRRLAANAALHAVQPLLAIAPLMAILTWWLAALTLRPLRQVARAVAERDTQSLAPLPAAGLPDELAPLVGSLNDLLARLADAIGSQRALSERLAGALDSQRAFVADAAHELRSPLTALKLQLELLGRAGDDAPARDAAVRTLGDGIERAAWLVEQLLALARSESGAAPLQAEPLDLAEVARGVLAAAVPQALARRAVLELHADAPVPVDGDATALAALVRNLVDNALRHTRDGARIEVRVERDGDSARLTVDDDGPGIPAADRERVFDRFVRRDHGSAGSGLGLAIVRQVAQRHGGTVLLADSPLGGLRAVFTLASRSAHAGLIPTP